MNFLIELNAVFAIRFVDYSTGEVDSGAASISECSGIKHQHRQVLANQSLNNVPAQIASQVSQTLLAKTVQRSAAAQLIMTLTLPSNAVAGCLSQRLSTSLLICRDVSCYSKRLLNLRATRTFSTDTALPKAQIQIKRH